MRAKLKNVTCLLLLGAACWAGYRVQGPRSGRVFLAAGASPQLDYLAGPESFSRVQNTKNTLEALCRQARLQAQTRLISLKVSPAKLLPAQSGPVDTIITDLQSAMEEFAGTEQELELAQELLNVLKSEERFKEWMEVYLQALYERPMDPLVARSAADALIIGRANCQEQAVLEALRHVASIPMTFAGKDKITLLLPRATTGVVATRLSPVGHSTERGS